MNGGFEVGTAIPLRALHRMPVEGPEGELHPHDYRVEVVIRRASLDERGMVCDLDVLNPALASVVAEIDGRDLEAIRPPDAEAVTVEVLARWVHGRMADPVRQAGGEELAVRVWESPTEFGGYRGPVGDRGG
ncbi:MAG TPA: 6-carboxytetrahydropterin synthase [Actinomycetota bacterium]|nr:6-carboxytetrahydropterin synthase [Actinomycetota bacterium]